jgi:hypothetical protein
MSLDLFNYTSDKANIPAEVVIKHPVTGEPTDVSIFVVGTDSTAAQACLDKQQALRFKEMTKGDGEMVIPEFDAQQNRESFLDLLVVCTTGWKNMAWKGEELAYSPENARMIYSKVPTIRDQVNKATGSRKLFFKD